MRYFFLACLITCLLVPPVAAQTQPAENLKNFDLVWETVNKEHFDPDFGGVDWKALYRNYRPRVEQAEDLAEFTLLTNKMLFELNLSHLVIFSEKDLKAYMPTLFAESTSGVDLRWTENGAVISRIKPGHPGEIAGLKPGYLITRINGRRIGEILSEVPKPPPFNSRNEKNFASYFLVGQLAASSASQVKLTYLDGDDQQHEVELSPRSRGTGINISNAMPPFHIEFDSKRLPENIGYCWFNHFAPPVETSLLNTLMTMRDTRGLIIDLRSNSGGYFKIMDRIIEQLISAEVALYKLQFRDRTIKRTIKPATNPYKKPIVILIDATSLSTSEFFAACLQALGRAVIIGERSPGYLLGARWIRLPNNLSFMHTNLLPIPFDGRIVEGKGVTPDIEVPLDRKTLLEGTDTQLKAAIDYLLNQPEMKK